MNIFLLNQYIFNEMKKKKKVSNIATFVTP